MNLSEFVVRETIVSDLAADTKEGAIREMVAGLTAAGHINNSDEEGAIQAILKREEQGTTGIGRGVAVPHTKHGSTKRLIGTIAVSRKGVDFSSLDGEPVQILFLLVSPTDRPGDHLRALETISRHLRNENFCRFLRQSKTKEQISELIEEADQNQLGT
jgi:PTS system fructose-specific IIA component/PTS system nitrogen regulatory IIA component